MLRLASEAKGKRLRQGPFSSVTLLRPAVFSGVVTAVVFISVCALAAISRLLYQQRRAQRTGGTKEENSQSMYTDYRTELHLHNSVRDNMKEYYI